MRILVIEDDRTIAGIIRQGLEDAHFSVEIARDGETGLQRARESDPDLIILDLMLPRLDGWSVCRELRLQRRTMPILMLTARDAIDDRVHGLELGADDYLTKPFDFRELRARVEALLRRNTVHRMRVMRIADLEIDTGTQQVRRAGQEIHLTPREYSLLEALARHEGHILTRDMIQDQVWRDDDSFSNTVNVYINFLRRKIDADHPLKLIHTVYGRGYVLRAPESGVS